MGFAGAPKCETSDELLEYLQRLKESKYNKQSQVSRLGNSVHVLLDELKR